MRWHWRRLTMVVAAISTPLLSMASSAGSLAQPYSISLPGGQTFKAIPTDPSIQTLLAGGTEEAAASGPVLLMETASDTAASAASSASVSASLSASASSASSESSTASSSASSSASATSSVDSSSNSNSSSTSGSYSSAASEGSGPTDSSGSYYNATVGYDCSCSDARKVSLMGASDYCLAPGARYSAKCGNQMLGELGECPREGARPCSDLGHVLTADSVCELDDKDDVYKCTASMDDQDIQSGKKRNKKKRSSSGDGGVDAGNGARASTGDSRSARALTAAAILLVGGFGGVVF